LRRTRSERRRQAERGLDGLTFFVYRTLLDAGMKNAEMWPGK